MLRALRHQHNDCTFLFPPLPGNAGCQAGDDTTLAASQLLLNSTLALKNKAELHLPETYAITTRSFTKPYIYGEQTLSALLVWEAGEGQERKGEKQKGRKHQIFTANVVFTTNLNSPYIQTLQTHGRKHAEECCPAF